MASVHKECGADITWAKREDDEDRFLPPLEYVGEVYLLEGQGRDKVGVQRHAYRLHICDPDRIIEWQDYQQRLAEAKGIEYVPLSDGRAAYEAAREKDREEQWNMALKVACPRCDAPAGEKCRSQQRQHIKTGEIVETRNPHPARMEAFEFWFRNEDDTDTPQ